MRARIILGTTLVFCVLLSACTATPPPSPSAEAPADHTGDGILRMGTLFPLTGDVSYIAAAQTAGVALAVSDLNAAGGVDGVPVELLSRDSGDATSGTLEASFAELVAAGVDVVIGPSSSVLAERIIPLAARSGIAVISPAASFPALTTASDAGLFFRTVASYSAQGAALGSVLAEGGSQKVALIYVDDELGRALADTVATGVAAAGSSLVISRAIGASETDFAPVAAELAASAPDAVIIASNYSAFESTKGLISAVLSAGFGAGKLWLTSQNTGDYSQAFPNGTLAGVTGIIDGVEPDAAFVARLHTVDPALTSYRYSAEAYDATILAALAAVVGGDDSGTSVAASLVDVSTGGIKCTTAPECLGALKTLTDIDYDGVSGPVNFTPDGDVSPAKYGIYSYDGENRFVFERIVVAG